MTAPPTRARLLWDATMADDRAAMLEDHAQEWEAAALREIGGSGPYLEYLDRAEQRRERAAQERAEADRLRAQARALHTTRTTNNKEH